MRDPIDSRAPSTDLLYRRAKKRVPGFAFDYLTGGCFSELNLARNTDEIRDYRLRPTYIGNYAGASQKTNLFGVEYDAPFGIAPVGLQGLIWPKSGAILAKAAYQNHIPFVLSTVGTADIESIAEITQGQAWFQLYHPAEDALRDKLLERAWAAGIKTLVILADTPTFGYRPKEIRNGLSIPPRMTLQNILQMTLHPTWSFSQLLNGVPSFATMKPYIPKGLNMKHLGLFMNKTFSGRLTEDKVKALRDKWKGTLVVKGIVNPTDAQKIISLGADGLIVSNHGGRQLERGQSTIRALGDLVAAFKGQIKIMIDSGLRDGSDIAIALALGADFAFLGRTPMLAVCALGSRGGEHVAAMLKKQLQQVMEQIGCEQIDDFPKFLIRENI